MSFYRYCMFAARHVATKITYRIVKDPLPFPACCAFGFIYGICVKISSFVHYIMSISIVSNNYGVVLAKEFAENFIHYHVPCTAGTILQPEALFASNGLFLDGGLKIGNRSESKGLQPLDIFSLIRQWPVSL